MFARITQFNIGPDIPSPTLKLTRRVKPTSDMASILTSAAKLSSQVPVAEVHDKLGIRRANEGEETVTLSEPMTPTLPLAFSKTEAEKAPNEQLDVSIDQDYLTPIYAMLSQYEKDGKSLSAFLDDLPMLFGKLDDEQTQRIISTVLTQHYAKGASDANR